MLGSALGFIGMTIALSIANSTAKKKFEESARANIKTYCEVQKGNIARRKVGVLSKSFFCDDGKFYLPDNYVNSGAELIPFEVELVGNHDVAKKYNPFLDSIVNKNFIISGGDNENRNRIIIEKLGDAYKNGIPAIVIHKSNKALVTHMKRYLSMNGLAILSPNKNAYLPFPSPELNPSTSDIVSLILSSIPDGYANDDEARLCLSILVDLQYRQKKQLDFDVFRNFDGDNVRKSIDEAVINNGIDKETADAIKRRLNEVSYKVIGSVASYLSALTRESNKIADITGDNTISRRNIIDTVKKGASVLIDVGASDNSLLLRLILNDLRQNMGGNNYTLIFDDVPIPLEETIVEDLLMNRNRSLLLSYEDFLSIPHLIRKGSKTDYVQEFFNNSNGIVLFGGKTLASSKWSEMFKTYQQAPISLTKTSSLGYSFIMPTVTNATTFDTRYAVEAPRVSSTILSDLSMSDTSLFQACIYNRDSDHIGFLELN